MLLPGPGADDCILGMLWINIWIRDYFEGYFIIVIEGK